MRALVYGIILAVLILVIARSIADWALVVTS